MRSGATWSGWRFWAWAVGGDGVSGRGKGGVGRRYVLSAPPSLWRGSGNRRRGEKCVRPLTGRPKTVEELVVFCVSGFGAAAAGGGGGLLR